jgi:hypothetical protein
MHYNVFILDDRNDRIVEFMNRFNEIDSRLFTIFHANSLCTAKSIFLGPNSFDGVFDIAFLDHDLTDTPYMDCSMKETGSEFVRWILMNGLISKLSSGGVFIHSFNSIGANYMRDLLLANYVFSTGNRSVFCFPAIWERKNFHMTLHFGEDCIDFYNRDVYYKGLLTLSNFHSSCLSSH